MKHVFEQTEIEATHIGTVFTAASSLNVHKGTHLDRGGVVEFPVNRALIVVNRYSKPSIQRTHRCKSQLYQRSIIDLLDFLFRPIVPRGVGLERTIKDSRLRGRLSRDRGDSAIFPHTKLGLTLLEKSSAARDKELRSMAAHGVVGESIDSGRK